MTDAPESPAVVPEIRGDTDFDWESFRLEVDRPFHVRLGELEIYMDRRRGEIRLATRYPGEDDPAEDEDRWGRWAPADDWTGHLSVRPVFPDRPIIVKPEVEFRLLTGATARIFVRVPMWARVETVEDDPDTLLTVATSVLSDTWWGSFTDGEMGYFLGTRARREMREDEFLEHICVCPVHLVNTSDADLLVTHIALRPLYLGVYRDGRRLWSNTTRVRYRGEDQESALEVEAGPPAEAGSPTLVTPAQQTMARGFTARTFARLRSSLGDLL